MGFYDLTNDLPIELSIEGNKNKNNELLLLKQYINNNNIPKNSIFILDRFYCSYDFINYLVSNNYKFIIRFRNNCINFDKIKDIKNIRILKYFDEYETVIPFEKYDNYVNIKKGKGKHIKINKNKANNNNDIKFKTANVQMKYEYTLVTNLSNETYKDEQIKILYKERWDVEVFFKLVKYNFKFEHLLEHNSSFTNDDYKKLYLVNLTIIYLAKIIEKTHFYNNSIKKEVIKKINNKDVIYSNKPNKSLTIKGVYKIINELFNSSLTVKKIESICKNYVLYSLNKKGVMKERKAKTPFLKWYVKGHSNRSLMYKIIEAKLKKDTFK
jgi:Transposase DDE domain